MMKSVTFRATVREGYRVTIPEADRIALGGVEIEDIVEVTVRKVNRNKGAST